MRSRAGTQSHVGRQNFVEIGGNLDLIIRKVAHPGPIPAGRVNEGARDVSQADSDIFGDIWSGFFLTCKNPKAMAHDFIPDVIPTEDF